MTTTPLTDQQLADIRARTDAATPGPWNTARDTGYSEEYGENFVANWTGPYMLGVGDISLGVGQEAEADLAFVLAARTDVPALLAELDRLRAERNRFRNAWNNARSRAQDHAADVKFTEVELEQARQQTTHATQSPYLCGAPHPDNLYCDLDPDHDHPHAEVSGNQWTP